MILCSQSSRRACTHPLVLTISENEIRQARHVRHVVHQSRRPQGRCNGRLSDGSEHGRQRFVCRTTCPSSRGTENRIGCVRVAGRSDVVAAGDTSVGCGVRFRQKHPNNRTRSARRRGFLLRASMVRRPTPAMTLHFVRSLVGYPKVSRMWTSSRLALSQRSNVLSLVSLGCQVNPRFRQAAFD
jgi:hypothetical protein